MVFKLGLDVHGVISEDPEFFASLSNLMINLGHMVYIITGREICDKLKKEIRDYNVFYHEILSITTYQKAQGVPISHLDGRQSQPMMDVKIWNPTKAMLCAKAGIHLMIDDSVVYEEFFRNIKTQYIIYTPEIKAFLRAIFFCEKGETS